MHHMYQNMPQPGMDSWRLDKTKCFSQQLLPCQKQCYFLFSLVLKMSSPSFLSLDELISLLCYDFSFYVPSFNNGKYIYVWLQPFFFCKTLTKPLTTFYLVVLSIHLFCLWGPTYFLLCLGLTPGSVLRNLSLLVRLMGPFMVGRIGLAACKANTLANVLSLALSLLALLYKNVLFSISIYFNIRNTKRTPTFTFFNEQ